jgi:vanillate O-demethylase ferredoxin subunit
MSTFQVRVARRTREAEDICSYELVRVDGAPLPSSEAGAHVDVHLPNNLVRQYSLCNAPGETHRYLIGVLRDAGSRAMHDDIDTGSILQISEPKNHFPLVAAGRTLLMAGGIGVTPILAMAEALAARGAAFEMHYCARAPERAAFRERIGASGFADCVHFHYDSGDADQKMNFATLLAVPVPAPDTDHYVCGSQGCIDHVLRAAEAQGWPAAQLHVESFGTAAVDISGDRVFDIRLASTGKVVTVPADKTVIAALAEHGVDIPYSCEQGVPDRCDMYLTQQEQASDD